MRLSARTRTRTRVGAVVVAAALLGSVGSVGAAGASADESVGPGARRSPKRTDVVAAFFPLAYAASVVGGKFVDVTNLTPSGSEPHDLELTPDSVDALQDAGLVVVMGKGFQPAVEKVARDRDRGTLRILDRLSIAGGGKPVVRAGDPHVWLDPILMGRIVDEVRVALTKVDPSHSRAFAANAARLHAELDALDTEFRTGLAHCDRRLLVTSHEAFGYVATRFGLRQEGITGLSPDAEPSAKRLAELSDLVDGKGVTTIFTEALVSPKVAETLAREAGGLRTAVLNPLEGLTDREVERGGDYFSVMRSNLRKIQRGLGCTTA
jgi:zinc transport system substrate-binding protein